MKFGEALKESVTKLQSKEFRERIKEEDDLMVRYLPILTQINEAGFLTENSQAGHRLSGKSYKDGAPYVITERAYLCGFMLESKVGKFLENMMLHTDKNAVYIAPCDDSFRGPPGTNVPLTHTVSRGKTDINTSLPLVLPDSTIDGLKKHLKINKSEPVVYVFCWDPIWNRIANKPNGLFTQVLRALSK